MKTSGCLHAPTTPYHLIVEQDSSIGKAAGYGLSGRSVGARVPVGAGFSPLHLVQTGYGAYSASYYN
jgi:hypothetical protein